MIFKNEIRESVEIAPGVKRKVIAYGGSLMTVEVIFEKGAIGALHTHPHEQVGYVVKGSFELEINGSKSIIKEGDGYYAAPHVVHGVVALEDSVLIDVFTPQREDFLK